MLTTKENLNITKRLRRNRKSEAIRQLTQENRLYPSDFVAPLFIIEGENKKETIATMPGVFRYSLDLAIEEVKQLYKLGIWAVNLFTYTPYEKKDAFGSYALDKKNLLYKAISSIKEQVPEILVMADIALDPYTDHGHDGLVDQHQNILNDETANVLAKMSVMAAASGVDFVSPSDMMDGRIGLIRSELDQAGFYNTGILSYAVKFASSFYGPFRDALDSAPQFGDKKTYQLNPANSKEAVLECLLDQEEGADMLMIKPALCYLDIIYQAKQKLDIPVGAYQVSGEYAMIMAADKMDWIDGKKAMEEALLSIKRAGADFIFTYAAKDMAMRLISHRESFDKEESPLRP